VVFNFSLRNGFESPTPPGSPALFSISAYVTDRVTDTTAPSPSAAWSSISAYVTDSSAPTPPASAAWFSISAYVTVSVTDTTGFTRVVFHFSLRNGFSHRHHRLQPRGFQFQPTPDPRVPDTSGGSPFYSEFIEHILIKIDSPVKSQLNSLRVVSGGATALT